MGMIKEDMRIKCKKKLKRKTKYDFYNFLIIASMLLLYKGFIHKWGSQNKFAFLLLVSFPFFLISDIVFYICLAILIFVLFFIFL